jgi:hypothetical protein
MNKDPLALRDLPELRAPDDLWPSVASRLETPVPHASRPMRFAAAAAVAAAAVAAVLWISPGPSPAPGAGDSRAPVLADARSASMQLERELAHRRSNVLAAGDAVELAWLESELRLTDELLSDRPRDVDLWLKRTVLLERMARRYETHDWHAQVRLASY